MICVADLDRSIAFYENAFGMAESHRLDFDAFTPVYLREPESGVEIELTLNKGTTTPYTHGTGYGHAAGAVDEIEAFRVRSAFRDYHPRALTTRRHVDRVVARFFFIKQKAAYEIEVLSSEGHYV